MEMLLQRTDDDFPPALRELGSWPPVLYVRGRLWMERPWVAIVGARAASGQAMRVAEEMAAELATRGYGVVSGGALGIDAAAHRGALSGGGYTASIMAGGLDCPYPDRNRSLFRAIEDSGGAMLSPFGTGCPPIRQNFVARNRVVAALAELVLVIEAEPRSGSLHTARFAAGLGRKLAALPGSPGCEALIARGALPVASGSQLVDLLTDRYQRPQVQLPLIESPEAQLLASLCSKTGQGAQALAQATGQPLRLVQRRLLALEMRGLVLALPGHRYLRSALAPQPIAGEAATD